ncbi:murein biosynthesis integral membrane protein MurJ [Pseudobacteroides cellulosolvens]|uniref:Probable lipid II flippase MurJ n=1 Tax=Pseudobacteroides cellulosolvens ATCC 35603 = DSM 2933 TaxID=398512 RepID=A0A0L6JLU4_9FIRM|nr:murein biosynthesis integral membrane protein MurJ [Pseudobacteroides cellulosolvens]KNY26372.1 integral membrane protein MviN [Pseudobacteroides cellulosolvens ATCC 35603 = DSM 2933]
MKRTAIILMLITIFSKVFGFVRDITLSYFYGASNVSDAYLISQVIPFVVFSFIGTGITTGYIPMYSKIEQNEGVIEGNRYTNNLVNILIVLCTCIIIAGLIFTNQIVRVFASGFEGETLALAVRFTKISLYGVYFTGLIYVFTGYLHIKGNYIIPALVGLPMNFFIILSIFVSSASSVLVLSIGSLIATIAQLMLLIPYVYRKGYRYKLVLDINDKNIRSMAYIALPVIIGVSVNQINILVDRTIASQIVVGGISALNYANRLNEFIQGIFVLSISTAIYPMISRMAAENNMKDFKRYLSESINGINLLVIPSTIGAMIFSEQIITLLFGRGAFDQDAIVLTSQALFFFAVGIVGFGLREILSRAFYALQDTKVPMINAAIALMMNIVLNIILSKFLGIGGLALATSISALFCTGLLFISLRKKIGSFGLKIITISFVKILCASLLMGVMAKLVYNTLIGKISSSILLIAAIGIGALVYFIIIYFMKIDDVDVIVSTIKGKVKKLLRHD